MHFFRVLVIGLTALPQANKYACASLYNTKRQRATHARAQVYMRHTQPSGLHARWEGLSGMSVAAHVHGKGMEEFERGGEVEQEEKASDSASAPEDVSLCRGREEALKTLKATSTEARR